jgi:hypothetical protein
LLLQLGVERLVLPQSAALPENFLKMLRILLLEHFISRKSALMLRW